MAGRVSILSLLAVLLLGPPSAMAQTPVVIVQPPYSDVTGTVHNFLGNAPVDRVCLGCHMVADPVAGTAQDTWLAVTPAWAPSTPPAPFPITTPAAAPGALTDSSSACLSCHDGVIATAVGDNSTAPTPDRGGSYQHDHPFRIGYFRDTVGNFIRATPLPQNREFWSIPDISGSTMTLPTGPVSTYQPIVADADPIVQRATLVRTRDGQIHCESCHNPHSNAVRPFLRDLPPKLCLVCHDK